jgi:nucleoside-diphosphate-sugar epimerase
MDNLLVMGASGFVGRAVVAEALKEAKPVTGQPQPAGTDIAFIECDLTDATGLERALADKSFTHVLHLASLPGDTGDPQQMVRVNVNGCLNMLECARKMKVRRFVLASSISAYEWYPGTKFNPPDYMPVDESHPCRPKDIYSTTKRMQELLVQTYYHQYELPTTVLRLTAIVGPQDEAEAAGGANSRSWTSRRVQIPHLSAEELCHYVIFAIQELNGSVSAKPSVRFSIVVVYLPRVVPSSYRLSGASSPALSGRRLLEHGARTRDRIRYVRGQEVTCIRTRVHVG